MTSIIKNFLQDEEGATAIEYGLIAGLIAAVIVTSVTNLGTQINTVFKDIYDKLKPAAPAAGGNGSS